MNFGLEQRDIDNIQNALVQFPEIEQALIFGSRAKGNSKPGSNAMSGEPSLNKVLLFRSEFS